MSDRSYMHDMEGAGTAGITLAGFLVGAVCGAGLALLLAPGPGGETRKKLGETARKLGSKASDVVSRVRDEAGDVADRVRNEATSARTNS